MRRPGVHASPAPVPVLRHPLLGGEQVVGVDRSVRSRTPGRRRCPTLSSHRVRPVGQRALPARRPHRVRRRAPPRPSIRRSSRTARSTAAGRRAAPAGAPESLLGLDLVAVVAQHQVVQPRAGQVDRCPSRAARRSPAAARHGWSTGGVPRWPCGWLPGNAGLATRGRRLRRSAWSWSTPPSAAAPGVAAWACISWKPSRIAIDSAIASEQPLSGPFRVITRLGMRAAVAAKVWAAARPSLMWRWDRRPPALPRVAAQHAPGSEQCRHAPGRAPRSASMA